MPDPLAYPVGETEHAALRDCMARIAATGYSESGVRERLGLKDLCDLKLRALPIYRNQRLSTRAPLDTAIDLFLLQSRVAAAEMCRLLNETQRESLVRCGVLSVDDTGASRANLSLYPVAGGLVFSDHCWPELSPAATPSLSRDQVMFVGTDSRWLARATVRRRVSKALDLCTGSGVQALLAAAHAERVLAVDINPRAVLCTRFNAQVWNRLNVEVRQGDLYEPLGRQRFDLITANPPFVPSPVGSLLFRDGGPSGEDVQRRIIAGLAEHLAPGGVAQIVTELGEHDQEPLEVRIRRWLEGAPLDLHVLRLRIHSAEAYAVGHASGDTATAFLESVDAWADNLKVQRFTRVVTVLLAFQWSEPTYGAPWTRVDEAYPPQRDAGVEIEAAFAAERAAKALELPRPIKAARATRSGSIVLRESRVLGGAMPSACAAVLSGQALPVEYELDGVERNLLAALDRPVEISTLVDITRSAGLSESTVFGALRSLLRKRLVEIE